MKIAPFGMPRDEIKRELEALRHPFSVAVERAKNPFNIGSIVRTAHSFLAKEIVLVGTEPWYERAAMGMQRYETLVELPDAAALIARARGAGQRLVVFEREAARVGLWEAELADGSVLVFGSENEGVSPELVAAAHEVVAIPMFGINNSYPITVAAGIAMAEWARRRYGGGRLVPAGGA